MKLLTVVMCISVYCVSGYTIFPLPGQSASVNPKFGRLDTRPLNSAQSVTATNVVPFSTLTTQPTTSYQTSEIPVISTTSTTSPPAPQPLAESSPSTSKAPEVRIVPTLSTVSNFVSTSELPKSSSFVPTVQTHPGTVTVINPLSTDLLPPLETSVSEAQPEVPIVKPIKPEIEAPARDLLPPKLS